MGPEVGRAAPQFELDGVDGSTGDDIKVSLERFRGSPVILAFYPADDSPVCTAQLRNYTDGIAQLEDLDATVLAISPQDPESHRRFAASHGGFAFALLSDVDKSAGRLYGVVGLLGLYRRSIFVVDAAGDLAFASRAIGPGFGFKPVNELAALVESLR